MAIEWQTRQPMAWGEGVLVAHGGIHLPRPLITTDNPLDLFGNTPLLRLNKVEELLGNRRVEIYAKAEWFNPGGSVKDRPALWMVNGAGC